MVGRIALLDLGTFVLILRFVPLNSCGGVSHEASSRGPHAQATEQIAPDQKLNSCCTDQP